MPETDLEMARRHVAEAERHIRSQEDIVAHLRDLGGDVATAEQLLCLFEETLDIHRAHLDRLELPPAA